jgi:hypothetical protein
MGADVDDNELLLMETIHLFVELLDQYFGNVTEVIFCQYRQWMCLNSRFTAVGYRLSVQQGIRPIRRIHFGRRDSRN